MNLTNKEIEKLKLIIKQIENKYTNKEILCKFIWINFFDKTINFMQYNKSPELNELLKISINNKTLWKIYTKN